VIAEFGLTSDSFFHGEQNRFGFWFRGNSRVKTLKAAASRPSSSILKAASAKLVLEYGHLALA
jgi:hypothetical protein